MTPDRRQTYSEILEKRLSTVYREKVLNDKSMDGASRMFREAVQADEELRQVAESRLRELSKIQERKCFISARHRDFLSAALAPGG